MCGFRPIVCLKSGMELEKNEDGTYRIEDRRTDITPPTINVSGNDTEWAKTDVTLTIRVTDTGSGVDTVTVNGVAQTLTAGQCRYTVTTTGDYVIVARDRNGNEATKIESVKIDRLAPTITFNPESKETLARTVTVTPSITESGSGIAVCKYLWSTSATTPSAESSYSGTYGGTFTSTGTITSPEGVTGLYYLHVYLKDNAGNVTTDRTDGTFNLTDKYVISNKEELIQFNKDIYATNGLEEEEVLLVADIDYNDTWDSTIRPFKGTFKGNGHTIKGIRIEQTSNVKGFISRNEGTIEDLHIENAYITTTTGQLGGIVGYNDATGIIEGCSFKGTITGNGGVGDVGGIAGQNSGTIRRCYTEQGTIMNVTHNTTGGGTIGGIAGSNGGVLEECYNAGSVTGTIACGIAGYHPNDGTTAKINKCYNLGTIKATGTAAGIGKGLTITNCYNKGTIEGGAACGIAMSEDGATVNYCYNAGRISGTAMAGGISGYLGASSTVQNCYNTGVVTNTGTSGTHIFTGGIVADTFGRTSVVRNCYNTGRISGNKDNYAGGIMGYWRDDYCTLTECYYESGSATVGVQCYIDDDGTDSTQGKDFTGQAQVRSGSMPTVLSIVGTTYFQADTGINDGDPILKWQVQ